MAEDHSGPFLGEDKPKEACGVFGIYAPGQDVARITYYGLYALQHRGQESAGIAVSDGGRITCHKGMGLVSEVFTEDTLEKLKGRMALGHVLYTTVKDGIAENIEPQNFYYQQGMIAIGHNGNLTNSAALRREMERAGAVFQSTSDSELIVSLIVRAGANDLISGIINTMDKIEGAYSLLLMSEKRMIGIRDPYGMRPLCLGRLADGYVLASESCALDIVGAQFIRDIEPGEVVIIDEKGVTSLHPHQPHQKALCIFEFVYFARPDSVIDGLTVQKARYALGRELARENPLDADLVIPVPDSGTSSALAYAAERGLPFSEGLMKNRYVGRTFIRPAQATRDLGVRLKLNPVREIIAGKKVIMIDDSIVRGTTSGKIVHMIRDAGAREVHLLVSSPSITHSCYYGIDTSGRGELIAATHCVEEIRQHIGADSLNYLSISGLHAAVAPICPKDVCNACFCGDYPIQVSADKA
ncbi:MAG: amidophosphoribosyltransferase [Syntrophaceticus sp.]